MTTEHTPDSAGVDNHIFLRGRIAAPPELRVLASGDEVYTFRVTVERPEGVSGTDTIDCAVPSRKAKSALTSASVGQAIEVGGSLRRRFWRAGGALASRYEVDVETVKVSRRRTDASAARTPASA